MVYIEMSFRSFGAHHVFIYQSIWLFYTYVEGLHIDMFVPYKQAERVVMYILRIFRGSYWRSIMCTSLKDANEGQAYWSDHGCGTEIVMS